jgi:hypothetical protein
MQTIESYLVSLGFQVNQPELAKFQGTLEGVAKVVERNTSGIVKDFLKLQFAVTGAFLAVGTGAIAMVDKVAMADQSYRLMGMQMFISKTAAQNFDIALKALGATMDQVAWDPELNQRFTELLTLQDRLEASLGPDFEGNMMKIRDLRMEWSKFTIEMQYLSYSVVNDLFNKLGLGSGSMLDKLREFNEYITSHLPEITTAINNVLVPALKDAWDILQQIWVIGKEAWVTFQQIVGTLSDDDSLKGTDVNMKSISATLEHVTSGAKQFLDAMMSVERVVAHLALALADIATGHFVDAAKQIGEAFKSVTADGAKVLGAGASATLGGSFIGAGVAGMGAQALGAVAGRGVADVVTHMGTAVSNFVGRGTSDLSPQERLSRNADTISGLTGIDASLIFGQLWHESAGGTNRGARDLHNLSGIKNPGGNGYRQFESDQDYDRFMAHLLVKDGLSANVKTGDEYARILKKGRYYEDSESTYARGIEAGQVKYIPQNIQIAVNVNKTNASPQDIAKATKAAIAEANDTANVRAQANAVGVFQ